MYISILVNSFSYYYSSYDVVIFVFFFFFFQAEDGIRDYKVTGVQTCALPISFLAASHDGAAMMQASLPWYPGGSLIENIKVVLTQGLAVTGGEPLYLLLANRDRKSTRLNSSHLVISYAVFCLKKKTQ